MLKLHPMKKNLVIISVVAIIAIGLIMFFQGNNGESAAASNADFMTAYAQAQNAVLVDVRTPDEFNTGHIKGAVNVDFYDMHFVENMKQLGTDKNFFIYCHSGNRSGQAVRMLTQLGMHVEDLSGGIAMHSDLLQ